MSMSKKDFIALANVIKQHNQIAQSWGQNIAHPTTAFTADQIDDLADFCKRTNSNFMRDRWLAYIAGECGPNGGGLKAKHLPHRKGLYVADCTCPECEVQREAILLGTKQSQR